MVKVKQNVKKKRKKITLRQHCATHSTGCRCLSELLSQLR